MAFGKGEEKETLGLDTFFVGCYDLSSMHNSAANKKHST